MRVPAPIGEGSRVEANELMTFSDPSRIAGLKAQARRLRVTLQETAGTTVSHAQSLELVAHQHGARDWNTLRARKGTPAIQDLSIGATVRGRYLGQRFIGRVIGLAQIGADAVRITLHFEEPVDVVRFESFSAYRQRVSCILGADSHSSRERTSDGTPHLVIHTVG